MRENNRKPIEKCRRKLPQFTTMNVIDGQAGLVIYSSLIFYSLTIDNILNIIVLIILASITITTLIGENGIITKTNEAKFKTEMAELKEQLELFNVDKLSENSDYLESTLTAGKELLEYNTKKPGETGNIYTIFTSIRRRTQR